MDNVEKEYDDKQGVSTKEHLVVRDKESGEEFVNQTSSIKDNLETWA